MDLRAEAPVDEETRARFRQIVDWNVELSSLIAAPVRAIVGGTHNTGRANPENVAYVVDYVQEGAARAGLEFVPATHPDFRRALELSYPLQG